MIYFKNTLSGQIEEFRPLESGKAGMYNCGPTVYGKVHIGNMRAYVFADLIKQVLQYNGYFVNQVINITDVGHLTDDGDEGADKMEEQSKKEKLGAAEITQKYTEYFKNALTELNIDYLTTKFPKASEHIGEQIAMIRTLEEKGFTYLTTDGVYYDTSKFPAYGELGHINIKGLQEGARVEKNAEKRNVTDFALWKFSKEARQQEWQSPWGLGFPGWHIECSAMSEKYLGKTFDIHTGGVDHIPTHHNNEIAQSVGAHDAPQARYWLHVNHITVDGQKISKSLGNTVHVEDLTAKGVSPLAYKYWLYTSHYSTLSNFTYEAVEAAQKALRKLYALMADNPLTGIPNHAYAERFRTHVNDNLDTPKAIALIWELAKDESVSDADKKATLLQFDAVLKLDLGNPIHGAGAAAAEIPEEITALAQKRNRARLERDFALADALREQIEKNGFSIADSDSETGWILYKKEA